MAKLSDKEIAQTAYNAGFRGDALVKAVAIALGESGGDPSQVYQPSLKGKHSAEFSVGLWQINVGGDLADRLTRWGLSSWRDLQNPATNAWAAYRLSKQGTDWTPWSVYNHGTYLKYVDRATVAAASVDTTVDSTPPPNTGGGDATNAGFELPGLNLGSFLGDLFDPVAHAFYFLIVIIIGLVIILVAFKSPKGQTE